MKRTICSGVVALLLASVPGFAAEAPVPDFFVEAAEAQLEVVGTQRDTNVRMIEMERLQQRLASARVEKAMTQPVTIELSSVERNQINDTGLRSRDNRYLVGVSRPVGATVNFSTARGLGKGTAKLALGAARGTGETGFVWTTAVRVPGAAALRLHLTGVDLPAGTALYVYNLAGQAFGPYTGRGPLGTGDLHTNTVFGDRLLLQLHSSAKAERAPKLTVAEVGVMGARFTVPRYGVNGVFDMSNTRSITENALCSNNAACVVNAACQSSTVVNNAKDAIATMLFQSGGSYYICTGGLIADNVTTSIIPLFLTANHCISRAAEASSLETYFDYAATCSSPNCTQPYNNVGETVGATIKFASSTSDVSLLQLSSAPTTPDGVAAYLGWTSTPIANTNNAALYRIHHPGGSPQSYSEGVVDTTKGTCRTLARGNFIYSRDTLGATEGGSSGSPVLNASGQIVGQLYGACGTNLNNVCDAANNGTVDGAFAVSYAGLAPFLNPGTGTCGAKGSSCTSGSQCCSSSCKGGTCR